MLWLLVYAATWAIERYEVAYHLMEILRSRFFVFTREPLLQSYVYTALDAFILKLGVVLFIFLRFFDRRGNFAQSLGLNLSRKEFSTPFFNIYLCVVIGLAAWEGRDPLFPYFPTALFFHDTALVGNAVVLVSILLVAPVAEEIFFRGFMYPAFQKSFGVTPAVICTTILFTLVHGPQMKWDIHGLSIIFISGIFLTLARARTGQTAYAMALHALYNGILTLAGIVKYGLEIGWHA